MKRKPPGERQTEVAGAAADARDEAGRAWARARPFVEAVAAQLSRTADPPSDGSGISARGFAEEALAVLRAAAAPGSVEAAAAVARLSTHAPLLAAVFQNIDLLYQHGHPRADGVAALVMTALARVDESAGDRLEDAFLTRSDPHRDIPDAPAPDGRRAEE
jgi:hypothetical protein